MAPVPKPRIVATDNDPSAVAADLRETILGLARRLRRQHFGDDFTPGEISVLSRLYHRGALSPSTLADLEHLPPQSVTRVLTSLEQRSLITRTVNPDNRRARIVRLLPAGVKVLDEYRSLRNVWLTSALTELSASDYEDLRKALRILKGLHG